jgi:hypothetical protein
MLQAGRSWIWFLLKSLDLLQFTPYFQLHYGSPQLLIEITSRNLPWGNMWPARKADNLTTTWEMIVKKI